MTDNLREQIEGSTEMREQQLDQKEPLPIEKLPEEWDRLDRYYMQLGEAAQGAGYDKGSFTGKAIGISICAAQLRASLALLAAHALEGEVPGDLCLRITDYLSKGGLFNPELMEHDKVCELLRDCRESLLEFSGRLHAANFAATAPASQQGRLSEGQVREAIKWTSSGLAVDYEVTTERLNALLTSAVPDSDMRLDALRYAFGPPATAERKATNLADEIYDWLVERGYPDAAILRDKIAEILKGESR